MKELPLLCNAEVVKNILAGMQIRLDTATDAVIITGTVASFGLATPVHNKL